MYHGDTLRFRWSVPRFIFQKPAGSSRESTVNLRHCVLDRLNDPQIIIPKQIKEKMAFRERSPVTRTQKVAKISKNGYF